MDARYTQAAELAAAEPATSRAPKASPVSPTVALFVAIVALAFGVAGVALGGASVATRQDVLLSQSPLPPSGYSLIGSLHAGQGEWVEKPPMPEAVTDHQALGIADSVVLLGGYGRNATMTTEGPLNSVVVYDAVFDSFNTSAAPPLPMSLYRFAAAVVLSPSGAADPIPDGRPTPPRSLTQPLSGVIVVAGGLSVTDGPQSAAVFLLPFRVDPSDPARSTVAAALAQARWVPGPDLPAARSDLAMAAVNGGVVATGGFDALFAPQSTTWQLSVNAATGQAGAAWESLPALPTPRGDLTAVADPSGTRVLTVGGWGGSVPGQEDFRAECEVLDLAAVAWETAAPLPFARGDKAMSLLRGRAVIVGGEVTSGRTAPCPWDPSTTCPVNAVPVHDTEALAMGGGTAQERKEAAVGAAWEQLAPHPGARFRFAAAVANNVLFTFGGQAESRRASGEVWALFEPQTPQLWVHRLSQE